MALAFEKASTDVRCVELMLSRWTSPRAPSVCTGAVSHETCQSSETTRCSSSSAAGPATGAP